MEILRALFFFNVSVESKLQEIALVFILSTHS